MTGAAPTPMRIERKKGSDLAVITLVGDFYSYNLPPVSEELDLLLTSGCRRVVFQLGGVSFVNSTALGYIIRTGKELKKVRGEAVLAEPSRFFATVIRTIGLTEAFKVFDSVDEALAYLETLETPG